MISRRDMILGGACVAAAGGAYALKPRTRFSLLGDRKLVNVVPPSFGTWESQSEDGLVKPELEGKLAALLYSELVSRIYQNTATGDAVMMLIAYGDTQSDLLQLHRPEACYPAVGFRLTLSAPAQVPLPNGAAIPARHVVAERSDRQESIIYWTRLGEYLPTTAGEQREARLLTAMRGLIPDGALFRLSMLNDQKPTFPRLNQFASELVMAVAPGARSALVGSDLARKVAV